VFERANKYQPGPEDVFIATQMRCGTTWIQQVVYEIVNRGKGDLSDKGHGHLYAVSPWIDGINSVALEDAPLVGEKPTRIIKTHLPTMLCPYSEEAKYIYATRHPVSCFASIVDYNRTLLGPFMPELDKWLSGSVATVCIGFLGPSTFKDGGDGHRTGKMCCSFTMRR
jgi:hypothetical protein